MYLYGIFIWKERLPELFEPWHTLAKSLPELVEKGVFREAVSEVGPIPRKPVV